MSFTEWLIEASFKRITGKPIKLNWYMSENTRQAVIESASEFGKAYIAGGKTKYSNQATGNSDRDYFDSKVDELLAEIKEAALEDEYRGDSYFIPAICTRLDAYMKVDGIQKGDRNFVISRLQNSLRIIEMTAFLYKD